MIKNSLVKKRSHRATQSTLEWLLKVGYHYATLQESQARELARVNRTTWERWRRGESSAPAATLELIRLHAFGEPPAGFSKDWQGFRFQNGKLIYEDNLVFTPGDIKATYYWKKLAFMHMQQNGLTYAKISSDLNDINNNREQYNG